MAILGPSDLPLVLKVDSNPLKLHALSQLGYPVVGIEVTEVQMEQVLRSAGDWIARYFPLEERYAYFMTQPLQAEYPIPTGAYWVREVAWDPATTRIDDIFGAESFLFNIGNISGIQGLLTDYFLLQSYRKFSQRILGTEGHWEYFHGTGNIRLFPVPRGTFPVVVKYLPSVTEFRSPQSRELMYRMFMSKVKEQLGHARRKLTGIPGPDGGSISLDGDKLVSEAKEELKEVEEFAIRMGEPLGPIVW